VSAATYIYDRDVGLNEIIAEALNASPGVPTSFNTLTTQSFQMGFWIALLPC
jgi:hypothetical protein